jgi:oligosaccharyltransferase complex subunit beta
LSRYEKAGNQELATSLSMWVFKEKGVLKVGKVEHKRQGEKKQADAYTVMEDVVSLHYIHWVLCIAL